jgi:hypothetical protein
MPEASEVPPFRPLRVLKTLDIHEIAVRVPWERDPELGKIAPGPIGEYLEIIDVDPASGVAYAPIDLDDPKVLAQDGLSPSEGNPQFHQQMVYAVAMSTIGHFERALGRVALWAAHRPPGWGKGNQWDTTFVRRLASILTRCGTRTPITVPLRRRSCSATFQCEQRTPTTLLVLQSSPVCLMTSSLMR